MLLGTVGFAASAYLLPAALVIAAVASVDLPGLRIEIRSIRRSIGAIGVSLGDLLAASISNSAWMLLYLGVDRTLLVVLSALFAAGKWAALGSAVGHRWRMFKRTRWPAASGRLFHH